MGPGSPSENLTKGPGSTPCSWISENMPVVEMLIVRMTRSFCTAAVSVTFIWAFMLISEMFLTGYIYYISTEMLKSLFAFREKTLKKGGYDMVCACVRVRAWGHICIEIDSIN